MSSFIPNHTKFQLKSKEELSLKTLKSDAKFKEKLTRGFKYDNNLVNFNTTTQMSENFFSMGSFFQSIQSLSCKNTEELSFMTLNSDAKFE